ncbi:MAG: single-stranded DNA-binding protein [Clostridiales bacterium]|nr:single-stranded DNA-binding protein [Clostridiales bacterium]
MNKVILIGRLTKDPEVKNTASQVTVCRFSIAVDRRFKDQNGQRQADFINCVAWRQTANFISSYFHKGSKIAVVGSIQTRTYDDAGGQKRYVTEVVVDEAEFADSSNSGSNGSRQSNEGYNNNASRSSSYSAPAPNSAAANAPTAPNRQITPDEDQGSSFPGSDDDISLPFPIDEDTGNLIF